MVNLLIRDVTELANIRIRWMRISCAKSVGCGCRCGFVAQSKLLAIVGFVATVIQVIQLSYLKLSSCKQTSSEQLKISVVHCQFVCNCTETKIANPTRSDFKYQTDFGFMKKCRIPSDSESESVTSLLLMLYSLGCIVISVMPGFHHSVAVLLLPFCRTILLFSGTVAVLTALT